MPPSDAPTSAGGVSSVRDDREHVARERVERVVAVGGPLALAVAAQVDRVRAPALVGERAERRAPRVPGLAAAVQQHDRRVGGIAGDVGRESVAVSSEEFDHAADTSEIAVWRTRCGLLLRFIPLAPSGDARRVRFEGTEIGDDLPHLLVGERAAVVEAPRGHLGAGNAAGDQREDLVVGGGLEELLELRVGALAAGRVVAVAFRAVRARRAACPMSV